MNHAHHEATQYSVDLYGSTEMGHPRHLRQHTHVKTPHLDRLADAGTLFEHCYSQSPVCTPSRACFLTGRYPRTARNRQNGADIPETEVLVTKMLADAGNNQGAARAGPG